MVSCAHPTTLRVYEKSNIGPIGDKTQWQKNVADVFAQVQHLNSDLQNALHDLKKYCSDNPKTQKHLKEEIALRQWKTFNVHIEVSR